MAAPPMARTTARLNVTISPVVTESGIVRTQFVAQVLSVIEREHRERAPRRGASLEPADGAEPIRHGGCVPFARRREITLRPTRPFCYTYPVVVKSARTNVQDSRSDDLVAEIARAYYERDLTQQRVAEQFGISRSQISRYLQEARDRDIVQIRIVAPETRDGDAEARLRAWFPHLRDVVVAAVFSDHDLVARRAVARAAARVLERSRQTGRDGLLRRGPDARRDGRPAGAGPDRRRHDRPGDGQRRPRGPRHRLQRDRRRGCRLHSPVEASRSTPRPSSGAVPVRPTSRRRTRRSATRWPSRDRRTSTSWASAP